MYIQEKYYCDHCLKEIDPDDVCPFCGFDIETYQEPKYALPHGTLLRQKYAIGSVIGEGGFGITYAGWDLALDKPIAIKEFYPQKSVSRNTEDSFLVTPNGTEDHQLIYYKGVEWFQHEARILAALGDTHNVIHVEDYFQANGTAYIIMDYIRGKSLDVYMKEQGGKLPAAEVMKLMRKPMEALGKVHQFGLLHGDISPANLMLAENGEVYLIDFGAACAIEGNDDARTLEPFFNRYFSPPEMLKSGKRDTYSDIYSLCAAMVFLMTGNTVPTALDREKNDTIPSTIRKLKLPYRQKQALLRGLELKVKQRTENIPLLMHGFYKIPLPKSEEEKKRYKRRMTWLGIGFAALYVGTILFTGLRMDEYIPSALQAISDKNADLAIELAEDCADGIYLGGERAANFWFQWAAKYGTDQQLFQIAQTYYQNDLDNLPENKPVALAYMEQCCAHGYPDAMNWLAVEYATGEHIGKDLRKALELLQQACDLGYSEAYVNLGILKKQEFQQPETAFSLFLKAAELGNAKGMSLVAYAYHDGIGVKQDLDEATKWMLMASSAGDPEAMGEIGGYYLYNTFITSNGNELKAVGTGMLLLDQAIWDGSASAHYYWSGVLSGKYDISGSYYAESMDIPNTDKAFAHMLKSAEMGYYPAMNEVAYLYEQGIGVEINMDQAAFWRKLSMESQR